MNQVDRDIGLALLKRLWHRKLISEEAYHSACRSRLFDRTRFENNAQESANIPGGEGAGRHDH